MDAYETFRDRAANNYASGERSAENDAHHLSLIATQLVSFVDGLQDKFDELDVARDVASYRGAARVWIRSKWDRAQLAALLADVFATELLEDRAAALFMEQVRAELEPVS